MHPRSAKYLRSATVVLGPKDKAIEVGEDGDDADAAVAWGTGEGATIEGEDKNKEAWDDEVDDTTLLATGDDPADED